ncbi:imelysin family protein [Phaeobacter sp. 11ANDIMAR09]|uniref:imelysin family protein n=1 Tax=Phaeobacter sp. 11ANDIMAR09 TaxID=1225647 RepID=UPI0006D69559|nr:imelysin family protein [Phaeobacter sp. 11ANDIMAR09]KPD12757.1 peptidase M75 [Phaeobacter sp. 11ANDIMAR09]
MKHTVFALAAAVSLCANVARADMVDEILDDQILPAMQALAESGQDLADVAKTICRPGASPLRDAYAQAFDDWIRVSHLRFGPTETDNRAFALAFWPDSRGKTPKTLATHLREADPALLTPQRFAQSSIAGRGFYALEFMYFDQDFTSAKPHEYRCALTAAMARDIATNATAIHQEWQDSYANQMRTASGRYQNKTEVKQELYKSLNTGLQMLADMRLGRPLGSFDKPRPKRAEAWRSGRSQHHIVLALQALQPLAIALADGDQDLTVQLEAAFQKPILRAQRLEDPRLKGVADPAKRFRIEALQQEVNDLRALIESDLGPSLGVLAGFNSLDGD